MMGSHSLSLALPPTNSAVSNMTEVPKTVAESTRKKKFSFEFYRGSYLRICLESQKLWTWKTFEQCWSCESLGELENGLSAFCIMR